MARRKRSRKTSRKRSRRASRKVVHIFKANPKRRRARKSSRKVSRRRRYRRNPGFGGVLPSTGFVMDAVYVTGGFIGTKVLAGMVLPMVGIQQPLFRIGAKVVLAGALGWAGKAFLGKSTGQFLMLGGMVEAVNDAVQTYVSPMVPALAMSSYPGLEYAGYDMSAYPQLNSYVSGMVDSEISEQV